jgi:hypothetical protein
MIIYILRNVAQKLELIFFFSPYREMEFYCIPESRNPLNAEGDKFVKEKYVNCVLFYVLTTGTQRSRIAWIVL